MNSPLVDAHNHLHHLSPTHPAFTSTNLSFCCATHVEEWARLSVIAGQSESIRPFYGVHPWRAASIDTELLERRLGEQLRHPGGVGEIGLDSLRGPTIAIQVALFSMQWRIAGMSRRPVVLHVVKAWGALREVWHDLFDRNIPVMLHGFSGSIEELSFYLSKGAYISIGPRYLLNMTDRKRDILRHIPLTQLLVETDFPYVPSGFPDAQDYALCLAETYTRIAHLYPYPLADLGQQVYQNALAFV